MFCPKCGQELAERTAFCEQCGANLNAAAQAASQQASQPVYQAAPTGSPVQSRSIALCIVLSILTCGIYGIYWLICIANDLNTASDRPNDTSGGMVFLLSLVTCNIYTWFWLYKAGEKVNIIRAKRGTPATDSSLLYLLLGIFGLGIVSYCLIQNELNEYAGK